MRIERYLAVAFLVIWAIILWAAVLTYKNSQSIITSGNDLARSNRILYQIESINKDITDIESYTRAYIITSDSGFSAITTTTMDTAYKRVGVLRNLLRGDTLQLSLLDSAIHLGEANAKRNLFLRNLIKQGSKEEAVKYVQSGVIVSSTRQIQAILAKMKTAEERKLARKESSFNDEQKFFFTVFVIRLIFIPLILLSIYFITVYNIRAFRRTEARLNETTGLLSGLIEHAPATIAMYDAEGRIVVANDAVAKPYGISIEQIKGKTVFDFLPASDAERIHKANTEVIRTNSKIETESTNMVNEKEETFLNIRFPLHDSKGKINYVGTIGLNITELKNKEDVILQLNTDLENRIQELEEANEELKNFTSSIAHDLRTPLRAISSFSNILIKEHAANLNPEAKRLIGILDENAQNMATLIDDLLSYAGIGRAKLLPVQTDVVELAKTVAVKLKHAYPLSNVVVSFGKPLILYCDPVLMKQALDNLFENSFKYSSRASAPSIQFDWYKQDSDVVFYLKDNGVGFDMRYSGKLFSMFNRLHAQEQFEGTGMGLAIVQRIIQKHGGKVWAEGKVDEGATFYFSLPLKHKPYNGIN